jgi:hypothetical protein
VTPARQLIDTQLKPLLAARGFTAQGGTFRHASAAGDVVVVETQLSSGSARERSEFFVNLALVPLPWLQYLRESRAPADLSGARAAEGLVSGRLDPPNRLQWIVTPADVPAVGAALAPALEQAVTAYLELLDRAAFLDLLERGAALPGRCPREAARAVLLLASGRTAEAAAALAAIARTDPDSPFVAWFC